MTHTILAQTEPLARVASALAGRYPNTALRISHLSRTERAHCVVTYQGPGVTLADMTHVASVVKVVLSRSDPDALAVTADILPGEFPFSVPVFFDTGSDDNIELRA